MRDSFSFKNFIRVVIVLFGFIPQCMTYVENEQEVKDLTYFLKRLRTVDYLPEMETALTEMSSTWDTTGGNFDGTDFKNVKGEYNILLDVDGPGVVHRIFTGQIFRPVLYTRIQVFIDHDTVPIFDMDVERFFNGSIGPFPYPLAFQKTYPGILFPIPFEKHCKIQLYNKYKTNWGNFWQVTYTKYPHEANVKSIQYPFTEKEKNEINQVCKSWLYAENNHPIAPSRWTIEKTGSIDPGETFSLKLEGQGIIKEMRIAITPNIPEILRNTRMIISWDGSKNKSVDVPLGYFFGNADYGSEKQFSSLLLGISDKESYSRFPMPFKNGAVLNFINTSKIKIDKIEVKLDIETPKRIPTNYGYFHASWNEIEINEQTYDNYPRLCKSPKPHFVLFDKKNLRGKYVGTLYHVAWPSQDWWGEGDWLFWSDEDGLIPRYHGTGSEEYFNSGWCEFDRKAISGFISDRPGNVLVYSFHLNDNFQFQKNIKVVNEIWTWPEDKIVESIYGGTSFWYCSQPVDADSKQALIKRRLQHSGRSLEDTGEWVTE